MMKKFLKSLLILTVVACMLASCGAIAGEKEDENNGAKTTVSPDEWVAAFDVSKLDNYTFTFKEDTEVLYEGKIERYGMYGSTVVKNGQTTHTFNEYHNDETWTDSWEDDKPENFYDFDFEILGDVLDKMEDHEKYGYALFTYSESAKGYHATMDIYDGADFLGDVYIYFKDGKLTKITIHAESDNIAETEIGKVDCVYTFTYQ